MKQGQTEAFLVKSSSGSRLVLTKTTAEENNPTARFMIRSCKHTQRLTRQFMKAGVFPPRRYVRFRLLVSLTLSVRRPAAPTRAEVSPNRGLLSRPLVPYVLVVKSSMAAFHTHTHTQRGHLALSSTASWRHRPSAACYRGSLQLHRVGAGDQCEGNDGGMVRHVGFLCFTWRKSKV